MAEGDASEGLNYRLRLNRGEAYKVPELRKKRLKQ